MDASDGKTQENKEVFEVGCSLLLFREICFRKEFLLYVLILVAMSMVYLVKSMPDEGDVCVVV